MRRRRRRFTNPAVKRRIAIGVMLLGATLSGAASYIRATSSGNPSSTYLLDVAGWLIVVVGAVLEARAAQFFFPGFTDATRRRAVAFVVLGLLGAIGGCVAASIVSDDDSPAIVAAAAMFVLVAGVGFFLAGAFTLGWHYGGDYAARRVERLSEDDW